jgi:magnesium transporter
MMEMKSSLIPTSKIKDCYYELIEHTKRIWEFSESQREAIEALNSTNESLMNDQTNNIMRTLTIFSVIVLPLNLIAGIFGMNTVDGMPFINNPYGFSVVISIMTIGCLSMIIFFIKKKWL